MTDNLKLATLGGGCFWCLEAVFQRLQGVEKIVSGYAGGEKENPTYNEVCSGSTGHAEVVQISYNPDLISFEQLLEVFWHTHDPTTLNRQGADIGTQYRSIILYHDEQQKTAAAASLKETDASDLWANPIVTEIAPLEIFYDGEAYHQNYFNNNPNQGYCSMVVAPKVSKFMKQYAHMLKPMAIDN